LLDLLQLPKNKFIFEYFFEIATVFGVFARNHPLLITFYSSSRQNSARRVAPADCTRAG
jgi:hypothetical protein